MLNKIQVALPLKAIKDYCHRNQIARLSLFGSALRDDFTADSDLDLLVEFEVGARVGYFRLVEMQQDLSVLVGRWVDLLTQGAISRYFRDDVLATAEVIYKAWHKEGRGNSN